MHTTTAVSPYKGHRFPHEVISHAAWLYFRFSLSYRDVEELLAERGLIVTYETMRQWCRKFGQTYANQLRRRRGQPGDKWHLDEVLLKINGKTSYLWRAVDQQGNVLDILVQSRRNKAAAKKFFRKLLKGYEYVPPVMITDKLGSYEAVKKEVVPSVEHRQHRRLNNRAENSHQPTRQGIVNLTDQHKRALHFRAILTSKILPCLHSDVFLAPFGGYCSHFRSSCCAKMG